jgi:hypothetical protein
MENTKILFYDKTEAGDYLETILHFNGCVFNCSEISEAILNETEGKKKTIEIHTCGNLYRGMK